MAASDEDFTELVQLLADSGEKKLAEAGLPGVPPPTAALSTGLPAPLQFTFPALIDVLINNPGFSAVQVGQCFGQGAGWFSRILATKAFQVALDPVRDRIANPEFSMTLDERFAALTIQSVSVLQEKIEKNGKALPDLTVVKIAELGVKALGMGLKKKEDEAPAVDPSKNSSELVAERIMAAMAKQKSATSAPIDVEVREVKDGE
jgi:hypothetical protein